MPQNPAAARFPPVGLQPAQKRAVFHLSSGAIFERGHSFLGHNFTRSDHFEKSNTFCKFSFLFFFKWWDGAIKKSC
ncbi:hypothetical protein GE278_07125 [Enterobacteriaceae bacterium Kacie_13]|nr:hypothetical protein GE278_07125 [Enterobacteriaceae bacterium Kacie_13]